MEPVSWRRQLGDQKRNQLFQNGIINSICRNCIQSLCQYSYELKIKINNVHQKRADSFAQKSDPEKKIRNFQKFHEIRDAKIVEGQKNYSQVSKCYRK